MLVEDIEVERKEGNECEEGREARLEGLNLVHLYLEIGHVDSLKFPSLKVPPDNSFHEVHRVVRDGRLMMVGKAVKGVGNLAPGFHKGGRV